MNLENLTKILEKILILCVLIGMFVFFINSVGTLFNMDWSDSDTYFLLIRRILALAIGIELVRFIDTYEIDTMLEILIFLLARQLLHMEIDGDYTYLLIVVIGISILIGMRIFLKKITSTMQIAQRIDIYRQHTTQQP